ncbi:FAD-dependent oxidoreductase [Aliiroseovarius subalbicans]|uniref:oxidoreductase n=1 Tax=Aliiroseovarius subalbicans TaxID=2925840 RepID=UPI001F56CA6D|nr:FAD-dependent oxidoreductase [Aliiroseovarius subalbicans]MCI2397859.1 FAD-dependent oxidoreductase [Aliiroseovarius subalbicans]
MTRDPRYDILFEPVKIGPVTAPNRFYQVPHCNGMGYRYPSSMAEMRRIKAEGGWGVVNTEEMEVSHMSELSPIPEARLWDDQDMPILQKMVDGVHAHGALAGAELAHLGGGASNHYSREIPVGPSARPVDLLDPIHVRPMDKTDIKALRKMHVDAALRCKKVGFDIIYLYCGHSMTTFTQFLSRQHNERGDEYGGSLENRARLLREVLSDVRDAVGDRSAVAIRMGLLLEERANGPVCNEEGRDVIHMMSDLVDLWDMQVGDWPFDSSTSRFEPQGYQDSHLAFVKQATGKPVVGVGRYTSPDAMVSLVKNGVIDLIGAARPSIADPFLPNKISEGRIEDIRECIGCNMCVTGDFLATPLRCTQNPTMGEEWRRGWHPERIPPAKAVESVLVVGGGPSGLEAARALGQRGYQVTLAEAEAETGGRVAVESRLPGLAEWGRVADYRQYQISQMANVAVYCQSRLTAEQVLEFEADHVVIATGSKWSASGKGRSNPHGIPTAPDAQVLTPDDISAGAIPRGPVIVFDDDYYYIGGLMAEKLRLEGHEVTYVTPAADVSHWTHNTMEQGRIQSRLIDLGVNIVPLHNLLAITGDMAELACIYSDKRQSLPCGAAVLVTMRDAIDDLFTDLSAMAQAPKSLTRIGDCLAPGTIAAATYSGHRFARELGEPIPDGVPFRRELPALADD